MWGGVSGIADWGPGQFGWMLSLCWVDNQCLLYTSSPEIAGWGPDQFRLMLPLGWVDTLPPPFTSSPERQRGMQDITLTLAFG